MPEEPKKIVPEKKVPIIKKPEAPPPKGTYSKINQYLLHFCVLSKIRHLIRIMLYYVLNCHLCYSVEQICQINVRIFHLAILYY